MTAPTLPKYQLLPADRSADDVERELLARWEEEDLFAQTMAAREGAPNWVFFEGPPTANGKPGIHHVFARTIKDLFCRHRAMKGYRVPRKAGWDTHGLPVEIEVEKQLGISGKQQIEALGVAEFNRLCRESVFRYRADWEKLSARMAFWLDYDHPYVTYTNDYVESVWWSLKTLFDKDLLYPRAQDAAVLHALRHGALEPRSSRSLAPIRTSRIRACTSRWISTATRTSASSSGRPRRGRSSRTPRSPCIRTSTTSR